MNAPIDFSKPFYINGSPQGEQHTEGVKVQGSGLDHQFPYLILTQEGTYMTKSLTISPTQAKSLGEYLTNFGYHFNPPVSDVNQLGYKISGNRVKIEASLYPDSNLTTYYEEIEVYTDASGVCFTQYTSDGRREMNEVSLSHEQIESFLRQQATHSPEFREMLKKLADEVKK